MPSLLHLMISFLSLLYLKFSSEAYGLRSDGFISTNIIRRDSVFSPFHNSSQSWLEKLHSAIERSKSRAKFINLQYYTLNEEGHNNNNNIVSTVKPNQEAEFLMTLYVGTPPFEIVAIADTGSDLIWTQCKPCTRCYKQIPPMFDPKHSSTYNPEPCDSDFCTDMGDLSSCDQRNNCRYTYTYGDKSYTKGVLSSETLTFNSTTSGSVAVPSIDFGCTLESAETFESHASGLVGLGRGRLSLVSQLSTKIDAKFSYCFVPYTQPNTSSIITFGPTATTPIHNLSSTPFSTLQPTLYTLTLESIGVGTRDVPANIDIVIDSGTTITYLASSLLSSVIDSVDKAASLEKTNDPTGTLELCYTGGASLLEKLPSLEFKFAGKANWVTPPENMFVETADEVLCLAVLETWRLYIWQHGSAEFLGRV